MTNINEAVGKYLNYISKKYQSEETLRAYKSDLRQFFRDMKSLSRAWLLKKVLTLTHYSEASRSRKIASVRGFLYWAHEQGHFPEDFSVIFGSVKTPRKLPHF